MTQQTVQTMKYFNKIITYFKFLNIEYGHLLPLLF